MLTEPEARALADAILQTAAVKPAAEALEFAQRAAQRAPQHPIVMNAAGGLLQQVGRFSQAAELYRAAVAIDPNSKVLWLNLATAYRSLGDVEAEGSTFDDSPVQPRFSQRPLPAFST